MTYSVILNIEEENIFEDYVKRTRRSKSDIIRDALFSYIDEENRKIKMLDELYHEHMKGKIDGQSY